MTSRRRKIGHTQNVKLTNLVTGESVDMGPADVSVGEDEASDLVAPGPPRAIPRPTAITHRWWPAAVKLPDEAAPIRLAKVYATPQGLYVYDQRPEDADGLSPRWFAPIDYSKTPRPVTGYVARNAGNQIVTSAGVVTVTPLGGCGCGAGALKHWMPSWARTAIAWEDMTT